MDPEPRRGTGRRYSTCKKEYRGPKNGARDSGRLSYARYVAPRFLGVELCTQDKLFDMIGCESIFPPRLALALPALLRTGQVALACTR